MKRFQRKLILIFAAVIFLSSLMSIFISKLLQHYFRVTLPEGIFSFTGVAVREVTLLILASVIMYIAISILMPKIVKPIVTLSDAMKKLSSGDFDVRVVELRRIDELGELMRDFNIMAKELKSNEYMKKDFIANVSHEFKTPIAVIDGYADLLSEDMVTEAERKEYAAKIAVEAQRLSGLSENILRLSKLNTQQINIKKSRFLLDEQIRQVILGYERKWSEKNISFSLDLPETFLCGEEDLISHVWTNIIDNSIKFSDKDGEISVKISRLDKMINVSVRDYGEGMDSETAARLFEPFYQGDTSHKSEGSGLGMSIVKRIVNLHGGSIFAKSKKGEGTEISVLLPADE